MVVHAGRRGRVYHQYARLFQPYNMKVLIYNHQLRW
jgi:hypothetical protein